MVGPGKLEILNVVMTVATPERWDVIHPRLYRVVTAVSANHPQKTIRFNISTFLLPITVRVRSR